MSAKTSTQKTNPVTQFVKDALEEYGKITWPTKEQAVLLTGLTIVVSTATVLLIGLLDLGFTELYQLVLDNL